MLGILRAVLKIVTVCMMVNSLIALAQMAQAVAAQWNY